MHTCHYQSVFTGILQIGFTGLYRILLIHVVGCTDFRMSCLQGSAMHQVADDQQLASLIDRMPRCMSYRFTCNDLSGQYRRKQTGADGSCIHS